MSDKIKAQLPAFAKRVQELLKICGRKDITYETGWRSTIGQLADNIQSDANRAAQESGNLALPGNSVSNLVAYGKHMATFFSAFNARYTYKRSLVWSRSSGGKFKDPENFVVFNHETGEGYEHRDEAYEMLLSKGKRVYVQGWSRASAPDEYIQLGKVLIGKGSVYNEPALTLQSSAILKNTSIRQVRDISDQDAARLRDIAATKNARALEMIKAYIDLYKGEEELKNVIDNSKKFTPQDKSKLDAIIAGAGNFSEPVAEGTGLSPKTLSSYKKKAGEYASAADKAAEISHKAGEHEMGKRWTDRANKKFSGITKATNKEFDNDAKITAANRKAK